MCVWFDKNRTCERKAYMLGSSKVYHMIWHPINFGMHRKR